MKQIRFFLLGLGCVLLSSGCRDRCKNLDCGPNGNCVEGECVCTSGFDGTFCDETVTAKFNKTYNLTETCRAGDDYYNVVMFGDADEANRLYIIGLWEKDEDTIVASVLDDGTTITIMRQAVDNVEIEGTGTSDEFGIGIVFSYDVYFPGQSAPFDVCGAELSTP